MANLLGDPFMVSVHGILMVLGWLWCMQIGGIIARYYKNFFKGWLHTHIALQIIGGLLTLAGFVVIVVFVQASGSSHFEGPHHIIGLFVVVLVLLQFLMGAVSFWYNVPGRVNWLDRVHHWMAYLLFLLAVGNIVWGLYLLLPWMMPAFVFCVLALIGLLLAMIGGLEVLSRRRRLAQYYTNELGEKNTEEHMALFGVYVLFATALVVVLVLLISSAQVFIY